jgi:hypothetical protein
VLFNIHIGAFFMKPADLILILGSVALSATAQLLLKLGTTAPTVRAAIAGDGAFAGRALALMTTPTLVGGLALYALSAGFWIAVLSRVDLSLAYPFVGLGFVLTFLRIPTKRATCTDLKRATVPI